MTIKDFKSKTKRFIDLPRVIFYIQPLHRKATFDLRSV